MRRPFCSGRTRPARSPSSTAKKEDEYCSRSMAQCSTSPQAGTFTVRVRTQTLVVVSLRFDRSDKMACTVTLRDETHRVVWPSNRSNSVSFGDRLTHRRSVIRHATEHLTPIDQLIDTLSDLQPDELCVTPSLSERSRCSQTFTLSVRT